MCYLVLVFGADCDLIGEHISLLIPNDKHVI